jgi:hypothetical protein
MRKVREGADQINRTGGGRETGPNFLGVGTLRVWWGFKGMPGLPLNRLLLALPSDDLARLMPDLEQVSCQREDILIDVDGFVCLQTHHGLRLGADAGQPSGRKNRKNWAAA